MLPPPPLQSLIATILSLEGKDRSVGRDKPCASTVARFAHRSQRMLQATSEQV